MVSKIHIGYTIDIFHFIYPGLSLTQFEINVIRLHPKYTAPGQIPIR